MLQGVTFRYEFSCHSTHLHAYKLDFLLLREAAMGKDKTLRAVERTHQTVVVGSSLTRLGLQSIVLCVTYNRRY